METRFGFRELVICVLLVGMIVSVWLAMVALDRQYIVLTRISDQVQEQTHDLAQIHRMVAQGVAAAAPAPASAPAPQTQASAPTATPAVSVTPTAPATQAAADPLGTWKGEGIDPFRRIKAAEKLPGYAQGDDLVRAFAAPPDKLTPLISSDASAGEIQGYVLESLLTRDADTLEWQPLLARRWRVSKDGLRIEFELRRGLTFSDGEPVTVDDVIFTHQWTMRPDVEDPRAKAYVEKITSVEQTGSDRVAFIFKEPYFQALDLAGGMSILPKHFYEKYTPTQFNRSIGLLMGTGPYCMADPTGWNREPGKPIELIRNERYWGELAPFERLIYRIINNDSARLTTFRNGDLDDLDPSPEQYKSMLEDKALLGRTQHFEFESPFAGYRFIGWNEQRNGKPTIFADKRVRQAMTMMIDREGICKQIELGLARVITGPFSPLTKQYDQNIKPWPYDVARAKALLKEAGFEDRDHSGVISRADGTRLSFKLSFRSSSDEYMRMVLFIKDNCAQAGVEVIPDAVEWGVLIQRLDQRDFDAITLGWTGDIEGDPYQIFDSSQIAGIGDDFIHYANPELDKLIETARTTVDEDKRMPMWHRVHQILHEDQPYTFLLAPKSRIFLVQRIHNIQRTHLGLNPDTEWFVPRNLWKWVKPN